jgi:hypothetical protein
VTDPYLPPATELREDLPPRRYGHAVGAAVLGYLTPMALLLAMDANLDQWKNQTSCIGTALAIGVMFLQFRQMSWRQVLLIAPPAALVLMLVLSIALDMAF